jgi:hypothetical protein
MGVTAGYEQDFQEEAIEPTPIPETSYEALGAGGHRSAWGTWFETSKSYSVMNSTYEVPSDCARLLHRACITWSMYIIPFPSRLYAQHAMCHSSAAAAHQAVNHLHPLDFAQVSAR